MPHDQFDEDELSDRELLNRLSKQLVNLEARIAGSRGGIPPSASLIAMASLEQQIIALRQQIKEVLNRIAEE